jgi:hypothetical protein
MLKGAGIPVNQKAKNWGKREASPHIKIEMSPANGV